MDGLLEEVHELQYLDIVHQNDKFMLNTHPLEAQYAIKFGYGPYTILNRSLVKALNELSIRARHLSN